MKIDRKHNDIAKIDLIKILIGTNYLGQEQITYISNAVLNAVKSYSAGKLPAVLIFDEFDAAAAMTLDATGYKVESVVFRTAAVSPMMKCSCVEIR